MEDGHVLGLKLGRQSGCPTALVCRTDYTAIGVCRGLQEAGVQVPEDVAVVGYGNIDLGAYFTPVLTTQAPPQDAICQTVIELLMNQLKGEHEVRQVTLKSKLVVRGSCGQKIHEKTLEKA